MTTLRKLLQKNMHTSHNKYFFHHVTTIRKIGRKKITDYSTSQIHTIWIPPVLFVLIFSSLNSIFSLKRNHNNVQKMHIWFSLHLQSPITSQIVTFILSWELDISRTKSGHCISSTQCQKNHFYYCCLRNVESLAHFSNSFSRYVSVIRGSSFFFFLHCLW